MRFQFSKIGTIEKILLWFIRLSSSSLCVFN